MKKLIVTALFVGSIGTASATEIVMECGPSKGQAYYNTQGWVEDGIKNGSLSLIRSDDGKLDVQIGDATGATFTAIQDGATVVTLLDGPAEWAVLAAYPLNVTEIYVFNRQRTHAALK